MVAAAFMLGAEGPARYQFLACTKVNPRKLQAAGSQGKDIDPRVTGRSGGHPVCTENPSDPIPDRNGRKRGTLKEIEAATVGSQRKAVQEGTSTGNLHAGQSRLVDCVMSAEEISVLCLSRPHIR